MEVRLIESGTCSIRSHNRGVDHSCMSRVKGLGLVAEEGLLMLIRKLLREAGRLVAPIARILLLIFAASAVEMNCCAKMLQFHELYIAVMVYVGVSSRCLELWCLSWAIELVGMRRVHNSSHADWKAASVEVMLLLVPVYNLTWLRRLSIQSLNVSIRLLESIGVELGIYRILSITFRVHE